MIKTIEIFPGKKKIHTNINKKYWLEKVISVSKTSGQCEFAVHAHAKILRNVIVCVCNQKR